MAVIRIISYHSFATVSKKLPVIQREKRLRESRGFSGANDSIRHMVLFPLFSTHVIPISSFDQSKVMILRALFTVQRTQSFKFSGRPKKSFIIFHSDDITTSLLLGTADEKRTGYDPRGAGMEEF